MVRCCCPSQVKESRSHESRQALTTILSPDVSTTTEIIRNFDVEVRATVRARTESEKRLLDQAAELQRDLEARIQEHHNMLDTLRLQKRLAYQDRLASQGIEGGKMISFLKGAKLWIDKRKIDL